ncbi:MAG TPA: VOC family protein [Streptosporangiaceae bacterium]|jgi:4a-hydroxytetrahydrobiopterin dehydratase
MADTAGAAGQALTLQELSDAVTGHGWRLVLGVARTTVRTRSLAQAAEVAGQIAAAGLGAGGSLAADVRADRVILTIRSPAGRRLTRRELDQVAPVTALVRELGLTPDPGTGGGAPRPVQVLEIAIDAMNIAAIRPFWMAVMGYAGEPGDDGPEGGLADPDGQGPTIWFQQMDQPRPQRNHIHFDVCVPHDEAARRIEATLAAGGRLLADDEAPAFWVLADPEGNEACVTTWQGRN